MEGKKNRNGKKNQRSRSVSLAGVTGWYDLCGSESTSARTNGASGLRRGTVEHAPSRGWPL